MSKINFVHFENQNLIIVRPPRDLLVISLILSILSDPVNIALGKPTSQSSTLSTSYSSLAVDGKTDGDFRRGSCSHTDTDDQPWFRLDLERSTTVERVSEEFDYSNMVMLCNSKNATEEAHYIFDFKV